MLIDYILRAFGVAFNLFTKTVQKGEDNLIKLESKFPRANKGYSFGFSVSWLLFIHLIRVDWTYVLILRGVTLMAIAYSFSLQEEESYLNPITNKELGSVVFCCLLKSLHEVSLFYYINKLESCSILFFFMLPFALCIVQQKKNMIAPPIFLLAVMSQGNEIFDLDIIVMLIAALAGFGGLLAQQNLNGEAQYSELFFLGCVQWSIGVISQCFTQGESYVNFFQFLILVFVGGIGLTSMRYLIERGEQLNSEDSWLLYSFILLMVLSFLVSSFSLSTIFTNLFTIGGLLALIYK